MSEYKNMLVVTNRSLCRGDYLMQIEKVTALRPAGLILREKDLSLSEYQELAKKVQAICKKNQVPLWIHSYPEVLEETGETHLHVSIPSLRKLRSENPDFLKNIQLSVSCHSLSDAMEAERAGAVQILLGNIFETDCKKGLPGRGLDFLKEVSTHISLPVYAIGGISCENMPQIMENGAAGGCMMSGFMKM